MRVAAYQAPLLPVGLKESLGLIQRRVQECEAKGVTILCCPEAILGGLADYADDPVTFAIPTSQIDAALAPLRSDSVTTIVGFTELGNTGQLHNSAAVCHRGAIIGVYRKWHPAIRRSVYEPGCEAPVFQLGAVTFGVIICNDSNFPEPANSIAARGTTVLFVPTNNGMAPAKAGPDLVFRTRQVDVDRATASGMWVVRADVAGRADGLVSHGSSAIVHPRGAVVQSALELTEDLLMAEIEVGPWAD